jgi:hypothetical protein
MSESFNWRTGFIEAGFILTSILLAFWIDAWWEDRQAERLESEILATVLAEVDENLLQLGSTRDRIMRSQADVDRFLRSTPADLRSQPEDIVVPQIVSLYVPWTFDPARAAAQVLATLPLTSSQESAEARRLVSELLAEFDDADRRASGVSSDADQLLEHLSRYAVRTASEGRDRINPMVARIGPDVLGELRADEVFAAAVIEIAHSREVYLTVLEQIETMLESLSTLIGER